MRYSFVSLIAASFALTAPLQAATFLFNTDPFAGSTALTTPGRQIVGGESFITFDIATDVFALDRTVFGVGNQIQFANDVAGNLPTSGVNTIVLRSFDNDSDAGTPFAAGNAANLIADQVTTPGPGFFIYFNQGLDLPRLVFSTDLNDSTADLKILFRITNLTGQAGRDAFPTFSAANFALVPEPAGVVLAAVSCVVGVLCFRRRRFVRDAECFHAGQLRAASG